MLTACGAKSEGGKQEVNASVDNNIPLEAAHDNQSLESMLEHIDAENEINDAAKPSAEAKLVDGEEHEADDFLYTTDEVADDKMDEEQTGNSESTNIDGIRPEFREAMNAYEAFYDEYCDFMKKYSENPTNLKLLAQYVDMMSKAEKTNKAFENWDEKEMNNEELKYYLEVNNRVMQKILDTAG